MVPRASAAMRVFICVSIMIIKRYECIYFYIGAYTLISSDEYLHSRYADPGVIGGYNEAAMADPARAKRLQARSYGD